MICQIGDRVLDTACAEATQGPPGIKTRGNVRGQFRSHAVLAKGGQCDGELRVCQPAAELEDYPKGVSRDDRLRFTMMQTSRTACVSRWTISELAILAELSAEVPSTSQDRPALSTTLAGAQG